MREQAPSPANPSIARAITPCSSGERAPRDATGDSADVFRVSRQARTLLQTFSRCRGRPAPFYAVFGGRVSELSCPSLATAVVRTSQISPQETQGPRPANRAGLLIREDAKPVILRHLPKRAAQGTSWLHAPGLRAAPPPPSPPPSASDRGACAPRSPSSPAASAACVRKAPKQGGSPPRGRIWPSLRPQLQGRQYRRPRHGRGRARTCGCSRAAASAARWIAAAHQEPMGGACRRPLRRPPLSSLARRTRTGRDTRPTCAPS